MFVSDTIRSTYTIFFFFFFGNFSPMMMDLISLNTSTWFDHSFRYLCSSHCILYHCTQHIPNTVPRDYSSKILRQQPRPHIPVMSHNLAELYLPVQNIQIQLKEQNEDDFHQNSEAVVKHPVTAVQPPQRIKPSVGTSWLFVSIHFNNQQPTPCRLTCELL